MKKGRIPHGNLMGLKKAKIDGPHPFKTDEGLLSKRKKLQRKGAVIVGVKYHYHDARSLKSGWYIHYYSTLEEYNEVQGISS